MHKIKQWKVLHRNHLPNFLENSNRNILINTECKTQDKVVTIFFIQICYPLKTYSLQLNVNA